MSDVVILPVVTKLDLSADRILSAAMDAKLERCFVVGRLEDGSFYFASSVADGGTVIWDMEIAKAQLLDLEIQKSPR